MRRASPGGFSLIEVVLSIGIFGGAIVVILALLPSLGDQAGASADAMVAQRLSDALRIEMRRLADQGGFDALGSRVPAAGRPAVDGLAFVASRDGALLHSRDYLPPQGVAALPIDAQYFLIELWRFPDPPLAYVAGGAVLPLMVRVTWPHRLPGLSAEVTLRNCSEVTFNSSILR